MESFSNPCDVVVTALAKVQATLGGTLKPTKKVNAGSRKYEYIELDALLTAALPVLEAQGLAVFHTQNETGVDCYLMHTSGQWVRSHAQVEVGRDLSAQDVGSAYTYARRYSLTALFALAASDDDGAAATEARKEAQAKAKDAPAPADVGVWAAGPGAEEKFAATLYAAGVTLPWNEVCQVCASRNYPTPDKMDAPTLERLTKFLVKEHGSQS